MKAVILDRFGGPDVLTIRDVPTPSPGPGQVLIKVEAAGINFAEILARQDRYAVTPKLPSIPGSEVAGTVVALGENVDSLVEGQRVAGALFASGNYEGGYAEYAVIDAAFAVPIPAALNFAEAAALTVQGLSALYLLRQAPARSRTVLITAAAGGVGSLLVQLAKLDGANKVIAVAGAEEKLAFAKSVGADIAISYLEPDWTSQLRTILGDVSPDVIYDSVGGDVTRDCLKLLGSRGQIILFGALNIQDFQLNVPDLLGLLFNNQSLSGFALAPLLTPASLRQSLEHLFALAVSGKIKITIGGSFPLNQVAEAHRLVENRETIGKVVLHP